MEAFSIALASVWSDSGFTAFTGGNAIMVLVGILLLYMAIGKGFEPLLLSPIAFGCILGNMPKTGFTTDPGVMQVILYGIQHEIFPPLIFPFLINPKPPPPKIFFYCFHMIFKITIIFNSVSD